MAMPSALLETPCEFDLPGDLSAVNGCDASGEPEAWMARLEPYCQRLIRQYGSSRELRQDLQGELYLSLCKLLHDFDPARGVPLDAYLYSKLRSTAFTYARSEWRREARELAASRLAGNTLEGMPVDGWARLEAEPERGFAEGVHLRESLLRAMESLSARQRSAIFLRYFQQREYEEIAGMLGIQAVTVRSLVRHGLRHLREALRGEGRGGRTARGFAGDSDL